ncbi:MAG: dTDP-4-dehydrorhamnose reductase [Acidobacteriota bacterium]
MKILITGAGGLVGKAMAGQLSGEHEVLSLGRRDLDITDDRAVMSSMLRDRPEVIINCAVLQVDACELDPALATEINVNGPRNLAAAAREIGARVIHFSTNYVFDGVETGRTPYTFEDQTHPINVYGLTKLEGERAVVDLQPESYIVRTAWVYGLGKASFLADAPRKLSRGEKVQAITDAYSTTTYVRDLVERVGEIIARGTPGIYHVVNSGTCSYFDFAVESARLMGLSDADADRLIVKVRDRDLQRAAPRPHWTPLECRLSTGIGLPPLRDWREALSAYIANDLRGNE